MSEIVKRLRSQPPPVQALLVNRAMSIAADEDAHGDFECYIARAFAWWADLLLEFDEETCVRLDLANEAEIALWVLIEARRQILEQRIERHLSN